MGSLVFQATLGGQVNLNGPNTASTFDIAVPATTGTMVTTGDTGTVTNTMLAGSIANAKLTNSSVTVGSTSIALGATSTTLDGVNIGATTAGTGAFTTLSASSTVSGTGFSTYLASPPAIGGTAAAAGTFTTLSGTTSVTTPIVKSASSLTLQTNGTTTAVTVDTSQNVGIGTTSPAVKLDVFGNANFGSIVSTGTGVSTGVTGVEIGGSRTGSGDAYIDIHSTASTDYETRIIRSSGINGNLQLLNTGTGDFQLQTAGAGALTFFTTATERMRIGSDGVIYMGCTALASDRPNAAGGTVKQVNGNTKVRVDTDSNPAFQFYSPTGGTSPVGSIAVNSSTTSYNITSDYRLKKDVEPMTGALAKIALLKPVIYKWKSTGEASQGFIAHELQEVAPDCVTGEKDAVATYIDEDGNEATRPVYQGIDTSFLIATLTAAIQEQQALITSLTNRIAALEAK